MSELIKWAYDRLMKEFNNSIGVCALLGQFKYESNLQSNNLQNSGNRKLSLSDEDYTKAVDEGSYGNFVYDAQGYGLAQWTYWARKKNLLDFAKTKGVSVGDFKLQIEFAILELKGYRNSYNAIKNARDMFECSCILTRDYEKPSDQSDSACRRRANWGLSLYEELAHTKPVEVEPEEKPLEQTDYVLYEVQKNDCLWNIARLFYSNGARYPEIMKENGLSNTTIYPGQILRIKGGKG